jgi:hypothetical protein
VKVGVYLSLFIEHDISYLEISILVCLLFGSITERSIACHLRAASVIIVHYVSAKEITFYCRNILTKEKVKVKFCPLINHHPMKRNGGMEL